MVILAASVNTSAESWFTKLTIVTAASSPCSCNCLQLTALHLTPVSCSAAGLDVEDVSDDLIVAFGQLLVHLTQLAGCDHLNHKK